MTNYHSLTAEEKEKIAAIKENVKQKFKEFKSHSLVYRMLHTGSFRKAVSETITKGLEPFLPEAENATKTTSDQYTSWEINNYQEGLKLNIPTICEPDPGFRKTLTMINKANDVSWKRVTESYLNEAEKQIYDQLVNFANVYVLAPYQRSVSK